MYGVFLHVRRGLSSGGLSKCAVAATEITYLSTESGLVSGYHGHSELKEQALPHTGLFARRRGGGSGDRSPGLRFHPSPGSYVNSSDCREDSDKAVGYGGPVGWLYRRS